MRIWLLLVLAVPSAMALPGIDNPAQDSTLTWRFLDDDGNETTGFPYLTPFSVSGESRNAGFEACGPRPFGFPTWWVPLVAEHFPLLPGPNSHFHVLRAPYNVSVMASALRWVVEFPFPFGAVDVEASLDAWSYSGEAVVLAQLGRGSAHSDLAQGVVAFDILFTGSGVAPAGSQLILSVNLTLSQPTQALLCGEVNVPGDNPIAVSTPANPITLELTMAPPLRIESLSLVNGALDVVVHAAQGYGQLDAAGGSTVLADGQSVAGRWTFPFATHEEPHPRYNGQAAFLPDDAGALTDARTVEVRFKDLAGAVAVGRLEPANAITECHLEGETTRCSGMVGGGIATPSPFALLAIAAALALTRRRLEVP